LRRQYGQIYDMSVFTPLTRAELETFLAPYGLGRLRDFQGIAAGTENSNFFISLEQGEYVLTLVERGPTQDLPFFIELLDVLQPRLDGKHVQTPNNQHCVQVGELLAHIHTATLKAPLVRRTDRGLDWMLEEGAKLVAGLDAAGTDLLRAALAEIHAHQTEILALPQANLHGDLFRDNVMFEGTHLTGVIDFYNACSGPMLYDLAITVNDWCSDELGALDAPRARALLGAYAGLRPFTAAEAQLWPLMLRVACVRFWLSRLIAAQSFAGMDVLIHDPKEFQDRLALRQKVGVALPFAF
jgi:homoserine kinase type II